MKAHGLTDKLETIVKYIGMDNIRKKELDVSQWETEHEFALEEEDKMILVPDTDIQIEYLNSDRLGWRTK